MHPEGRVPLLIIEYQNETLIKKTSLYESSIITQYIDELTPKDHPEVPRLTPNVSLLKAEMRLWTYWCDQVFKPDLDHYKYEFLRSTTRNEIHDFIPNHYAP